LCKLLGSIIGPKHRAGQTVTPIKAEIRITH
jgi:hypothetical protein